MTGRKRISLMALTLATPISAQTVPVTNSGASASSTAQDGIADIVVTAERRSARLQDVPIAITAANAAQLKAQGVTNVFDVSKITPSFNSNQTGGSATPILRGVGTTNDAAGDEPSVATYIDGFYQGSGIAANIPFNNIDRIEILKGPQGTLYGRNATGGLVSIITRTPSQDLSGEASATYGNYSTVRGDAYLTGGIAKNISADISATFQHQGTGFDRDLVRGGHIGTYQYHAVRSKVLIDLGGDNSLTLGGSYSRAKSNVFNIVQPFPGTTPLALGPGVITTNGPRQYAGSNLPAYNIREYSANATLKLDLGFANFVSLSQWRRVSNYNNVEGDGTSADGVFLGSQLSLPAGAPLGSALVPTTVVPVTFSYSVKQILPYFVTQELQLVSKPGSRFSWIAGGFFQDSKDGYHDLNLNYSLQAPPFGVITADNKTRALAGYAQATYKFDNGLSLTGGVRYSSERKSINGVTVIPAFAITSPGDQSKTFNSFTYRAAIDYRVAPELLLYATANKGFKSGTFVGNTPTADPVKPEILYAYEAGFKADPSRMLRINGSAYFYNYKDIQTFVNTTQGLSVLQNAAKARMYGMELAVELAPARGLNLSGGFGYEHARYRDFPNATAFLPSPSGGNYQTLVDVSGNQILRTPKVSANALATYRFDVGAAGKITLNGSASYSGAFYWDSTNQVKQKAYALVDLSALFTTANNRYSIRLWGKNVTNKLYANFRQRELRFDRVAWGDPATYGVTVGVKF